MVQLTVTSTAKKYDNRPVNDKNWQKEAWRRVSKKKLIFLYINNIFTI